MIIKIDNVYASILFESESDSFKDYLNDKIAKAINPLDPNRYKNRAYRMHHWDGRVKIYDEKNNRVLVGLFPKLYNCVKEVQNDYPDFKVSIEDDRESKVFSSMKDYSVPLALSNGSDPDIKLRDHQMRALEFSFKSQQGVVNGSTGSGKTEVAAGIIKESLPNIAKDDLIFFMCQSKDIAHQTQERLHKRLEIPIGFWGDGEENLKQVNVVMVGTLGSALKDPKDSIKITSAKDKYTMHFATDYVPLFINSLNIKLMIKTYIANHDPRYKYDDQIFDTLREIVSDPHMDDKRIHKALKWQLDSWDKLIIKKNKKGFKKFNHAKDVLKKVKVLIIDECHHAASDTYQRVVSFMPHARMRIGLTATVPDKNDIVKYTKFIGLFTTSIIKVTNHEMIMKGISAKPTIKLVPIYKPQDLDFQVEDNIPANTPKRMLKLVKYQMAYKIGVIKNDYRNALISLLTDKLVNLHKGPVLIVVNSVEHGEILEGYLDAFDIKYAFMDHSKDSSQREAIKNGVRDGSVQVLIATQLINEGVDIPVLKYLVYASAGKSSIQVIQRVGRMLRKSEGKATTTIFDIQDHTTKTLYNQARNRVSTYRKEQFDVIGDE